VGRGEDKLEAAGALAGEPVARLFRDMGRMIVEDQFYGGVRRVSRIGSLRNSMNSRLRWRSLTKA